MIVVLEERANEVLLVPGAPFPQPLFGILETWKDVVDVNEHAWIQTRQDLEKQAIHVAIQFGDMGGIYEKNVSRLQGVEHGQVDILEWRRQEMDVIVRLEQRLHEGGKRLDKGAPDLVVKEKLIRIECDTRGVTGTNLNNALGTQPPDHQMEHNRVAIGVGLIVIAVAKSGRALLLEWNAGIHLCQQLQ